MSTSPDSVTETKERIIKDLEQRLTSLNQSKIDQVQTHLSAALDNVMKGVEYRFFSEHGMKKVRVTPTDPLVERYAC